jgi:guanylate kinase
MINVKDRSIFILGVTGSGKSTIVKQMLKTHKEYMPVVEATTRPIREGEVDGVDYHYKNDVEFRKMINENMFAEYRTHHTEHGDWSYGTPITSYVKGNKYIQAIDLDVFDNLVKLGIIDINEVYIIYIHVKREMVLNKLTETRKDDKESERRLDDDLCKYNLEKIMTYPINIVMLQNYEQPVDERVADIFGALELDSHMHRHKPLDPNNVYEIISIFDRYW